MGGDPLPAPTAERFGHSVSSSLLSSADHLTGLAAGLEPVGIVQGTCVLRWAWYGLRSPYGGMSPLGSGSRRLKRRYFDQPVALSFGRRPGWRDWSNPASGATQQAQPVPTTPTPRGLVRPIVYESGSWTDWPCEHTSQANGRHNHGVNFAQPWIEDLWQHGFSTARDRMLAEAALAGAHGVVGVADEVRTPRRGAREFVLRGTAVRVSGGRPPEAIWSTQLAGERLALAAAAGWVPVSVVGALASVRIWPSCSTSAQRSGGWRGVSEILQVEAAHATAAQRARARLGDRCDGDALHGVRVELSERHIADEDDEVRCQMVGSRLRRLAAPAPRAGRFETMATLR